MTAFLKFCKNFWRILRPYWTSEQKWSAALLLAGVLASVIIQVRIMVIFNYWIQAFYDALQTFNGHGILLLMGEFVIILLLAIIIFTYGSYFAGLLANRWRLWMTEKYLDRWLSHNTFYGLQLLNKKIDNPDQRISEDLNEFPQLTIGLITGLVGSILSLGAFSVILWHLSGTFELHLFHRKFAIHGYMFWATLIYAALGTWITHLIGKKLTPLNYQQQQFNANFRFGLIRAREAAEQIALYHGDKNERFRLRHLFQPVFDNFFSIIKIQKYMGFFTNGYNLMIQIIGILIALPKYLAKKITFGTLIQITRAFETVVNALSYIVSSYSTIASWAAVIRRLSEFDQFMQETEITMTQSPFTFDVTTDELKAQNLRITLPNNTVLQNNINFSVKKGESLLITGNSGAGKSTLLRALAKLWPYGAGHIVLPQSKKILFLPQKPYLPLGTLREALTYPSNETFSDAQITQALTLCGLERFLPYLNETHYWAMEFSLGEQQLIAFARIFLHQPEWIFLDEATSALDEDNESKMYQLLKGKLPETSIISVGHRSSLPQWHAKILHLDAMPC